MRDRWAAAWQFFFFFCVWWPYHQIFKSECCCKSSHPAEILCRSPELGCQGHTVRPCLVTLLCVHGAGLEDVVWGLVCMPALTQGCVRIWNANPFQMCFQTTVSLCAGGKWLFVGFAPASVWGRGAPVSRCGAWLVQVALNLLWDIDLQFPGNLQDCLLASVDCQLWRTHTHTQHVHFLHTV